MSPNGTALDFASTTTFSSQVNGSLITHYRDLIYRIDTGATLYDSTKLAVTPNLYDKDTLSKTITGGTITYKGSVKWTRTLWNGTAFATSKEVQFYSATTPTANLSVTSPITSKSATFTTVYSQAESVPVESYQYFLYTVSGTLLESSPVYYNQKLSQNYDGFIDDTTYQVKCVIKNAYGQTVDTGMVSFSVDYVQPNISFIPTVTLNSDLGATVIDLASPVQIMGNSSGTIAYINDYMTPGNMGLSLDSIGGYLSYDLDIPYTFTLTVVWNPTRESFGVGVGPFPAEFDGVIASFDDGFYQVGYNFSTQSFYVSYHSFGNIETITQFAGPLNYDPYIIGITNYGMTVCQNNIIVCNIVIPQGV